MTRRAFSIAALAAVVLLVGSALLARRSEPGHTGAAPVYSVAELRHIVADAPAWLGRTVRVRARAIHFQCQLPCPDLPPTGMALEDPVRDGFPMATIALRTASGYVPLALDPRPESRWERFIRRLPVIGGQLPEPGQETTVLRVRLVPAHCPILRGPGCFEAVLQS